MKDFFELYERQSKLSVSIGHNSVADWCIEIHDLKGLKITNRSEPCIKIQECDYKLALAKAYVQLCEYLSKTRGGY
jgi:hypothetical protein|tara:strand:- start:2503 stop:2730 length:228 start_codon:yes stop_codon:yes gene_type:complete